jgi:hypothetical protein
MPHHDPQRLHELLGPDAIPCRRALGGESGVALPPLHDHHVHLHLIDERQLAPHGIAAAVDLGGDPIAFARRPSDGFPRISFAGAFLTAPGGYPVGRPWAPDEITHEVTDASTHPGVPGGAATAVDEQAACGASIIKVALNRDAGPVFDLVTLAAIVSSAHARDLPVVAHVQGEGMMRLALDAEADALAHAPFSEWLDGASIARARATGQRWISTLSIHDGADAERAAINLATFAAAGGRVLYGTDLGNGERPGGIQHDELRSLDSAGVRGAALIVALTDPWPLAEPPHGVSTFVPGEPPADLDAVPAWLAGATVVPTEELIHDDHS